MVPLGLLRFGVIRYAFVRMRYKMLKGRLHFFQGGSSSIGVSTISHNLGALDEAAGFGCGGRMALLILPIVAYFSFYTVKRSSLSILLVGCRTEDDIYWMRSYGFTSTVGMDLFSYSKNVLLGDIHATTLEDSSQDVVLLGWMISYTHDPEAVVRECERILKPGGLLGIGIEHNPARGERTAGTPRVNSLNSAVDIKRLLDRVVRHSLVFEYDHYNDANGDFSAVVISRLLGPAC